jgi:hypothetical protein
MLMSISMMHEGRWISKSNRQGLTKIKKSVISMGSKLYNKLPSYIKELDNYRAFKRELKSFLLCHAFYSVDEFISM